MAYPVLTKDDLASYSGRPASTYTDYADQAILQATLLFKIGTCLADFPESSPESDLAQMAIVSMADAIYLVQPFQEVLSNPFSSETIGSYSYSKVSGAIQGGLPTGISWFDLAVRHLGVCDPGIITGGGIEVFEHDGIFIEGSLPGNVRLLGPQEMTPAIDGAVTVHGGMLVPQDDGVDSDALDGFEQDGGLLEG